jgi:hypothetical protein
MTKIPLDIDTTPLAHAIERSKRKTMTKHVMTKALINVIEGALVGLAAVVAWAMLVTLFSL